MEYPSAGSTPRKNITVREVNDLVERGYVYTVQESIQGLSAGTVFDLMIDLSSVNSDKNLYLVESLFSISSGEAIAEYYLPGDYDASGADSFTPYNRNEESNNGSEISFTYKTDGSTTPGTKLPTSYQMSAEKHSGGSGATGDNYLTKISKSLSRLLRITHTGNEPFNLDIRFIYVEM